MDEEAKALAQLPELPHECKSAWTMLTEKMSDCATRRGMYFLLCGYTYRDAAEMGGLLNQKPLTDCVRRHGLRDLVYRTDRLITNHRTVAMMATEALIAKGETGELEAESGRDLAVIAGVSTDKVTAWEKAQQSSPAALEFLQQLSATLGETGMQLDVRLSPVGSGYQDGGMDCTRPTDSAEPPARAIPASSDALRHDSGAAETLEAETVTPDRD